MYSKIDLPEGVPLLSTYYMYITGGCNLACRHCWITPTFEATGGTGECLDFNLYKLAVDEGLPLGLASIKFTGGEPLLHPDFVKMADYATEMGLSTLVETNGTLLTLEMARHLKEKTSVDFISVSLDGATAITHDHMRNVPGSFHQAQQGIAYLVEAGYKPQVIMSLYPGNVSEIQALVEWSEKVGCGSVKFNLLQPSGRGMQMKKRGEWLDIDQLIKLGRWVERDLQKKVSIQLHFSWPMAFRGVSQLLGSQGICNIHQILGVLASGELSMCGIGTQVNDLIYGQLGKDKVREVWVSNPLILAIRDKISDGLEGICINCIHRNICLGNCLAQNYLASKRFTVPFWFCQLAEENGLFPFSRKQSVDVL